MALAQEFGLNGPAEAVGKSDRDFFSAEQAEGFSKDEQEIIGTGKPVVDKEEKLIWPSGQLTWMSTTKMPVRDAGGNIIGTFVCPATPPRVSALKKGCANMRRPSRVWKRWSRW